MKTAAIWGGAFAARHACVGGFKPERYHISTSSAAALAFVFCLKPPFFFNAGAEDEQRRFSISSLSSCPL